MSITVIAHTDTSAELEVVGTHGYQEVIAAGLSAMNIPASYRHAITGIDGHPLGQPITDEVVRVWTQHAVIAHEARCPMCTERRVVNVPAYAYAAWRRGENLQFAWPEASPSEREALITGYCDQCWDEMFKEDN